ncbi:MAG: DNA repair protein RecO [Bacteroidota bacterium]
MILKTEGVTLGYIKYRDSSIIARVFTREFGFQSFLVTGIRSKKAKNNPGFFEGFTILDLVLYQSKRSTLHRLSEFKLSEPCHSIRTEVRKRAIALFLSEVLYRLLQAEEEQHVPLYTFLRQSILQFDGASAAIENFHLQFLLRLASYLGFGFESISSHSQIALGHSEEIDHLASDLLQADYFSPFDMTGKQRSEILEAMIKYYQTHLHQGLEVKSLAVLQSIFK